MWGSIAGWLSPSALLNQAGQPSCEPGGWRAADDLVVDTW